MVVGAGDRLLGERAAGGEVAGVEEAGVEQPQEEAEQRAGCEADGHAGGDHPAPPPAGKRAEAAEQQRKNLRAVSHHGEGGTNMMRYEPV